MARRSSPASISTPSKAFDAVAAESATVLPSGALAGDRRWAFVDGQDRFVNGKQFPAIHRIRTRIDPDASTAVFDDLHFRLAGDATPLEDWVSERLATPVRLRENPTAGFPDDTDAPGPTLIATATLEAVAGWFDLTLEQTRARFRANIEIGGVPAFWEDAFYGGTCRIGAAADAEGPGVALIMVNPCARCAVPSRDARTGEPIAGFQKRFAEQRRATLAPGVDATPFDHYYRLAVNTRLAPGSIGGAIRVGDAVHDGRRDRGRGPGRDGGAGLMLTRMVGFVTTTAPERAKAFYGDTLGFRFIEDDGFALSFDASGTLLRVAKAQSFTPSQATVLGWEVDDIAGAVRELAARGVVFEQFNLPFLVQDALGIWTAPNGDRVAWFKDPDGNTLSVSCHQSRP